MCKKWYVPRVLFYIEKLSHTTFWVIQNLIHATVNLHSISEMSYLKVSYIQGWLDLRGFLIIIKLKFLKYLQFI
jgi:hypothetical protein